MMALMGIVIRKDLARGCRVVQDGDPCRWPGRFHVAWALLTGGGYSAVCDGHFGWLLRTQEHYVSQWHIMQSECGMPGTAWLNNVNMCEIFDQHRTVDPL